MTGTKNAALAIALCALAVLDPGVVAAQASTLAVPFVRYRLSNGLDVLLAPDSAMAQVSIELWFDSGGRHEPVGRFGMAHFFEHAMPFGDGVVRTKLGRQLFDSLRIDGNAKTRFDYTRYFLLTKPDGLDYFLLITADRLRADPTRELTPTRVEAHRRNVAAEIQRAADGTWGWAVKNALQAGTFGAQFPYGHHLYGSEAETADVSADDLVRWFRANVRPENSTLLVVGRFDTSNARAVIQRDFSDIPGGQRPPRQVLTGAPQPRLTDAVSIKGSRNYVFVNWPVLKWWSDETASLILLQHILTERLGRSRPPFVAQASAETEFWELSGRFGLMAEFARASDRSRVEVWLRSELIRINADGVSDAELERARESEVAAIRTELARIGWEESRTELLGEGLVFADDPGAYLQMLSREQAVTSVSIKAVAARRLATSGFSLAVFGGAIPSP